MKPFHWFLAVLLFILLGSSIYLNWYDTKSLSDCAKTTKAYLKDVDYIGKKYTFIYRYEINHRIYENHEWIINKGISDAYSIGDSIWIEYGCNDHQVSKAKLKSVE